MKCFHGTTQENFVNLINGGDKPSGAWNCSDSDGCFYVYPVNKFYDLDSMNAEEITNEGLRNALDSATITAAFQMKTQNIVILELDIPEYELQDDWSCENMSDIASFTESFDKDWIKKVYITEFNSMYSPFFVPNLKNPNLSYVDEKLKEVASFIQNTDDSSIIYCNMLDAMQESLTESTVNDVLA